MQSLGDFSAATAVLVIRDSPRFVLSRNRSGYLVGLCSVPQLPDLLEVEIRIHSDLAELFDGALHLESPDVGFHDAEVDVGELVDPGSTIPIGWTRMQPADTKGEFSLLSYNVLADKLVDPKELLHVDPSNLSWGNRRRKILRHIDRLKPSIICLQELQSTSNVTARHRDNHYWDLQEQLKSSFMAYSGEYVRRAHMKLAIGCAVFWSCEWERLARQSVRFSDLLKVKCEGHNQQTRAFFTDGNQVAIIVLLRHATTGQHLIVVSTHITCAWQTPASQIAQAAVMTEQVEKFHQAAKARFGFSHAAVIIAGDFNSTPTSGLYNFMLDGKLPVPQIAGVSPNVPDSERIEFPFDSLKHDLELASAYRTVAKSEPQFTCFGGGSTVLTTDQLASQDDKIYPGTSVSVVPLPAWVPGSAEQRLRVLTMPLALDYIFYQHDALQPVAVLDVPTIQAGRSERALPNSQHPSDHVPILATFNFVQHE
eukprot:m.159197 g.159197  ORF g.159197 m.159197 type:complete len:481 (-) comp53007_c0_seq4:17-1459(-)